MIPIKCQKISSEIELLNLRFCFKNKTVADIGCGVGKVSRLIANEGAEVYGIDIPDLITKALETAENKNAIFINGTARALPLDSNSVDIVVFMASFHHIPFIEMPIAIDECYRVLKEQGVICFIEPFPEKESYYELTRLVEDESEIQKKAYEIILSIDKQRFEFMDESCYFLERSFDDFENLINIYVNNAARKNKIINDAKHIIEQKGLTIENVRFKSYVRMNLLKKINVFKTNEYRQEHNFNLMKFIQRNPYQSFLDIFLLAII